MDISIIIACSRPEFIGECLKGFTYQQTMFQFEVIIVGKVAGVKNVAANVQLLEVEALHPNIKRNRGLALAKANLVALLDDDTIPCAEWVETAVQGSRNYPNTVLTGPENPYPSSNPFSLLSHRLLSSPVAEFSKAHTHLKFEIMRWFDVPFCNAVFPKQMWFTSGGLNETIPWHMDDFHFFFQLRNKISFLNVPQLAIAHHRYPASLKKLVSYKWKLRKETGEKLMNYPQIYWRITPVAVAVAVSLIILLLMFVLLLIKPIVVVFLMLFYFILLLYTTSTRVGFSVPKNLFQGIAILSSVHIVSIVGIYWGLLSESIKKICLLNLNNFEFK